MGLDPEGAYGIKVEKKWFPFTWDRSLYTVMALP